MTIKCSNCESEFSERLKTCPTCGTARPSNFRQDSSPSRRSDGFHPKWHKDYPAARMCEAYGCPLAGTISHHTGPGGPWWCYVHATLGHLDIQVFTKRINHNAGEISKIIGEIDTISHQPFSSSNINDTYALWNDIIELCSIERQPGEDDE